MNMYPTLTNMRSYLSEKFSTLHARAVRESLWTKLIGRCASLEVFPEQAPQKSPNRTFTGVTEIPLEQILGTLNRRGDFDNQFRPLKKYLRDRWVNTYLTLEREGWSPILVHKVGNAYYVEDGHHRVSVARSLGMAFIQARVWEYPIQVQQSHKCQRVPCPERSSARVCASVTE